MQANTKTTLSSLGFLFFLLLCNYIQPIYSQGIEFKEGSFDDILAEARRTNKTVFVDAYTTWCGPCKTMAKTVFLDSTVGDFYNNNFISCKIDMEKGEGPKVKQVFGVRFYPTYLYVSGQGELLHRGGGVLSNEAFIGLGKTALDQNKQIRTFFKRYQAGERSILFLEEYILVLQYALLPADEIKDELAKALTPGHWRNPKLWHFLKQTASPYTSLLFQKMTEYEDFYAEEAGADSVSKFILKVLSSTIERKATDAARKKNPKLLEDEINQAIQLVPGKKEEIQILHEYLKYARMNLSASDDTLLLTYRKYAELFLMPDDAHDWMTFTKTILYKHPNSKALMEQATEWARYIISIWSSFESYENLVQILYKQDKYEEALKAIDKALELYNPKQNKEYQKNGLVSKKESILSKLNQKD